MTKNIIGAEHPTNSPSRPKSTHPDPITGEPGAHPIGVGVGATGGGLTGAAIGAAGGPVGVAVGAVAGAIIGGMAGKDVAESYDPTAEDAYWREHFRSRPYVSPEDRYERFQPAYRYGWESRFEHAGRSFEEVEPELQQRWTTAAPDLSWDKARYATRDAWNRVEMTTMRPHGAAPGTPAPDIVPEFRDEPHAGHPSTAQTDERTRPDDRKTAP